MAAATEAQSAPERPGFLMRIALRYVRIVDAISEFFGEVSKYLVIVVVVVGFSNVVLRYLGRWIQQRLTSNVFIETQWYLYGLVFLLGFAYILKHNINVRVDFWYAEWPKKRRARIDFIGHILGLLPFCILAIWVLWSPTLRSFGRLPDGTWPTYRVWQIWEQSPDPNGLPRAPIKGVIIVGFTLLLLQALAEMVKLWTVLTDREEMLSLHIAEPDAPIRIE
jgi:TRAP-type mannitol/chloroaromatic compound transport system permease small subunit